MPGRKCKAQLGLRSLDMGRRSILIAMAEGVACYPALILFLNAAAGSALSAINNAEEMTFEKMMAAFVVYALMFALFAVFSGGLHSYIVRKRERSHFSENVFISFMFALFFEFAYTAGVILSPHKDTGAATLGWLIGSVLVLAFSMLFFLAGKYLFGVIYRIKKGR